MSRRHRTTLVNIEFFARATRSALGRTQLRLKGRAETLQVSGAFAHLFRQM